MYLFHFFLITGLTKFKIDSARKHSKNGRPQKPNKPSAPMNRLPFNKVQHFIDFISQPQYVQDIAFGQRTLKLSTGQKVQIPDVIRTVIGSRIISSYQAFCDEVILLTTSINMGCFIKYFCVTCKAPKS